MSISAFMEKHYRHFNARETLAAAKGYRQFMDDGGAMMISLAGAMSTAELGVSLAEMIRKGKIHAISCTAANLEEDLFNLFAHNEYKVIENWRALSVQDEVDLLESGYNRVTDTCIPESVMMHMQSRLVKYWKDAADKGESYFPFEYMFKILDEPDLKQHYQIPVEHSWMIAAKEAGIPVFSPGIEDSTLGNMFTARVMDGTVKSHHALKSGTAQKLVLNMLSTSVMIQLGKVKGNKMVDMQLSNHKLVGRGTRMVMDATGIGQEAAEKLLKENGNVRKAIDAFAKSKSGN